MENISPPHSRVTLEGHGEGKSSLGADTQEMHAVVHITWQEREPDPPALISQSLTGRKLVRNKEQVRLTHW